MARDRVARCRVTEVMCGLLHRSAGLTYGPARGLTPFAGWTRKRTMPPMVTIIDNRPPRHPEKAHRPDTPVLRKPDWIRVRVPAAGGRYGETRRILREHGLVTVCEEA